MPSRPSISLAFIVAAGLFLHAAPLQAHCDTLAGPVVKAARTALEAKDLKPLLKWIKPAAEPELRGAFERTLRVRAGGDEARELADRYFFETVVRLHRAGEGAPYTGLKSDLADPGGLIAASDRALDAASIDQLLAAVSTQVHAALRERHQHALEARKHADESVEAGRHYVQAYVEYLHLVEALQQAVAGGGHGAEAGRPHGSPLQEGAAKR